MDISRDALALAAENAARLGLADKSVGHFGQAATFDPRGNYGRLARAAREV